MKTIGSDIPRRQIEIFFRNNKFMPLKGLRVNYMNLDSKGLSSEQVPLQRKSFPHTQIILEAHAYKRKEGNKKRRKKLRLRPKKHVSRQETPRSRRPRKRRSAKTRKRRQERQ